MAIKPDQIELVLLRAEHGEGDQFSSEYQTELIEFAKRTGPVSRRVFTMDEVDGGGGLLGEFIFKNAVPVLTVLGPALVAYISGRMGRKVKLKVADVEIEARNSSEVEKLLKLATDYQNGRSSPAEKS